MQAQRAVEVRGGGNSRLRRPAGTLAALSHDDAKAHVSVHVSLSCKSSDRGGAASAHTSSLLPSAAPLKQHG